MMTSASHRLRLLAVLTTLLLLVGTGAAAAYWTATTELHGTAGTATVGLEQSAGQASSSLSVTYSAEISAAAGAVTLTNTGSRTATYSVTVNADATSDRGLADSLAVSIVAVDSTLGCSPAVASGQAGPMPARRQGPLEPGASVVLCVVTSLRGQDLAALSEKSLSLSISSTLRYADGDAWTVGAPMINARQSVTKASSAPQGTEMRCSSGSNAPWYVAVEFPRSTGKENETTYRVFLAREATPDKRVAYDRAPGGWDTVVRFDHGSAPVTSYANSPHGGLGRTWVTVEQKVKGSGGWSPVAYAKVRLVETSQGGSIGVECGW